MGPVQGEGGRPLGTEQRIDHDDPPLPSTSVMFDRSKPRTW
ncbi:hypothetical protein [Streptomyces koyangensis]